MAKDGNDANSPVAAEILHYFLRNPEAADSLTEIARWRLLQGNVQRSVEATFAAVDLLLSEGYLRRETRVGTDPIFQLNVDRLGDSEVFVAGHEKGCNDSAR